MKTIRKKIIKAIKLIFILFFIFSSIIFVRYAFFPVRSPLENEKYFFDQDGLVRISLNSRVFATLESENSTYIQPTHYKIYYVSNSDVRSCLIEWNSPVENVDGLFPVYKKRFYFVDEGINFNADRDKILLTPMISGYDIYYVFDASRYDEERKSSNSHLGLMKISTSQIINKGSGPFSNYYFKIPSWEILQETYNNNLDIVERINKHNEIYPIYNGTYLKLPIIAENNINFGKKIYSAEEIIQKMKENNIELNIKINNEDVNIFE